MDTSEWVGRVGDVWAEHWPRTDRTFAPVDAALVEAVVGALDGVAAPRILEIGCGAGTTALHVAERVPQARITGIDLSPALIGTATRRAADEPRCSFHRADAGHWSAETGFDLILSRHGVMFFDDPVAALGHVRILAKPDAPLLFSCFRAVEANPWASGLVDLLPQGAPADRPVPDPAAPDSPVPDSPVPGPFAFSDPARVSAILERAGWQGAAATPLDYAYVAGGGDDPVADAIDFFRRIGPAARAIRALEGAARDRLLAALERSVRAHRVGDRIVYPAAAWLWTARAAKRGETA